MSRLRMLGPLTILLALVAGCAKMPPTHYYVLGAQDSRAAPETRAQGWVVGVRSFQVDAPYDQDQIVYRVGEDTREVGFYAYHRWAASPSRMLPVLVAQAMHGVEGLRTIEPVMAGRAYTAYLDGRVLNLEEVDRADGQRVRATLSLWLTAGDGTELWTGTVEAEGETQASDVETVVDRMSEVLAEALHRAGQDLAAALRADR